MKERFRQNFCQSYDNNWAIITVLQMSDDCPIVQIHSNYDDRDRDIVHNRKLY